MVFVYEKSKIYILDCQYSVSKMSGSMVSFSGLNKVKERILHE